MSIEIHNNESRLEILNFPDGESFVKFDYDGKPITIVWKYENDAELMILAQIYSFFENNYSEKFLYIPYYPHARQDRKTTKNQPFSLRVFTKILLDTIKGTNTKLRVLDIHSTVLDSILANYSADDWHFYNSSFYSRMIENPNQYDAIICPDKGALYRCLDWHKFLWAITGKKDFYFIECEKTRDPITGKLSNPYMSYDGMEKLNRSLKVLMIDDIGTGFGTHIQLAEYLKTINPNVVIDLFVSHSSFVKGTRPVLNAFDKVYTTNSLASGSKAIVESGSNNIHSFDCTLPLKKEQET